MDRTSFNALLSLSCGAFLLSASASAAGYYNFGMHWKGALNPYRLGATVAYVSGFTAGATALAGNGDGSLDGPSGIARDALGNIYVADTNNSRISKYDSSGVFQGWIGKIAVSPTGGAAGCKGAAVGTFTPGWCTGGTSTSGTGDGMMSSPKGVALDTSGILYVADTGNHRINKYASSGTFVGWIGKIATSPTGGAVGCNGAAVGTFTPRWCKGGTSTSGTDDGMLNSPSAIAFDSFGDLFVTDTGNHRVNQYNQMGIFLGWIGGIGTTPTGGVTGCDVAAAGTSTPGWCFGGTSAAGTGDGMMSSPNGIALDASDNIYVVDTDNARIEKFDSSGVFQGWIGNVDISPTGGAAGCSATPAFSFTPGWCTGGLSNFGNGDGMMHTPKGIALDSSANIYVSDQSNHRITKYNSSGVPQGWLGSINITKPTGGAAGCTTMAPHSFTPGWCTGGLPNSPFGATGGRLSQPFGLALDGSGNLYAVDTVFNRINKYSAAGASSGSAAQSDAVFYSWHRSTSSGAAGSGDGMMSTPRGLARDSSGNLYLVDSSNYRISKYNSSGVFQGWAGMVSGSPTGGAAGCSGAAFQSITPGWCTGGIAYGSVLEGGMEFPRGIAIDSSGNLYIADTNNSRIMKYNSAGVYQAWIGKINMSPTGGAAGCSGAAAGGFTPGWCTGGTAASGTGDGMMSAPSGIVIDSTGNVYVTDTSNSRINKYDSSGAFLGWIGSIATSPTGGAAGCSGAAVGTFTPGWCTGGTSASGAGDGMMSSPYGIVLDASGNLYVSDKGNHRINKYNSSGVFLGWIGTIATSPTGGAPSCNGAAAGTFTPGWCTGGTSASGTGDGMMNAPTGVTLDSLGNIYVSDSVNSRINKYNSSGAFQGWIGKINTSPTGGATGCQGAAVGTVTPGWCKGGTATSGTGDGMMNTPDMLMLDSSGNLYVSDSSNNRVIRFSLQSR